MAAGISVDPGHARRAGAAQGLVLAFAGFLPILSILSLAPAVPTLVAHFRDVPHAAVVVPLLVTTPGLMVAILSPFAGWISDRYGRRGPILLATSLYAFAGASPFVFDGLWAVLGSRVLVGITETFVLVIVNALFADYFANAQRRTWITVQGLLGPALGAASITGAGWLASRQWNAAFLIYLLAIPVFVGMVVCLFEPDRARGNVAELNPAHVPGAFRWRVAAAFCSVTVFASIVYYAFIVNGGVAFQAIGVDSAARIGAIMGPVSVAVLLGSLLFNLLSRFWRSEYIIATFLLLMGLGTAGMGASTSVAMMAAFATVQQVGAGMTVTCLIFWVARLLPEHHRGFGFGLWVSSFFVAQFISPAVVGMIGAIGGNVLTAFIGLGGAAIVMAILMVALANRLPQPLNTDPVLPTGH